MDLGGLKKQCNQTFSKSENLICSTSAATSTATAILVSAGSAALVEVVFAIIEWFLLAVWISFCALRHNAFR